LSPTMAWPDDPRALGDTRRHRNWLSGGRRPVRIRSLSGAWRRSDRTRYVRESAEAVGSLACQVSLLRAIFWGRQYLVYIREKLTPLARGNHLVGSRLRRPWATRNIPWQFAVSGTQRRQS